MITNKQGFTLTLSPSPIIVNRAIAPWFIICVLWVLCLVPVSSSSAQATVLSSQASGPHIQVELVYEKNALVPGQTVLLGVLLQPEKDWHTYWQNPGDSGEPPMLNWAASSQGQSLDWVNFGDIKWPIPRAIPVAHLVNYGYDGTNLLMVPVTVSANAPTGEMVDIKLDLSWLVCKEDCIPGWATLHISLPIAQEANNSEFADLFTQTKAALPKALVNFPVDGEFETTQTHIVVEIPNFSEQVAIDEWTLFPTRNYVIDHAAEQSWLVDNQDNTVRVLIPRSAYFDGKAQTLEWLVSNGERAFYISTKQNQLSAIASLGSDKRISLLALLSYLGMAFLGGLILNLMPCVLPILSIKAMALQQSKQATGHKFAYLFGVLACFNLFAIIVVALQLSGQQIGWGFHMQEPIVVAMLAFLFVFIAMVLFDALQMASKFAGVGQSLVAGDSAGSHFATGALAVIVASPCTAPFMAAALGIAFVSPVYVTFLIFNALAIGFALPVTLLFISSKVHAWLPKPGAWMETFKHFLAFPMLATVAWLAWVFAGQVGTQAQFLLLLCLISFCMCLWLLSKTVNKTVRTLVYTGLVLSVIVPLYVAQSLKGMTDSLGVSTQSMSIDYDPVKLASLRSQNQVVLVNMTADWCITCKVNEQVALTSEAVLNALQQDGVHYMVGDWTNKNDQILKFLSEYERAGVPLYVVYAGEQSEQILPQILSPNMVIDAINKAKQEIQNVNK